MAPASCSWRHLNAVIVLATLLCRSTALPQSPSTVTSQKVTVDGRGVTLSSSSVPNTTPQSSTASPSTPSTTTTQSGVSAKGNSAGSTSREHKGPLDQAGLDALGAAIQVNSTETGNSSHSSGTEWPEKKTASSSGVDAVLVAPDTPAKKPVGSHGSIFSHMPEWMSDSYTMSIVLPISIGIAAAGFLIIVVVCLRCVRRCLQRRCYRKVIKTTPITQLKIPDRMKLLADTSDEEF